MTLVTMKIVAFASNSFLTYIWYHIDIPVDHDFYGLILVDFFESNISRFFRIDITRGKKVTALFITSVWPTVARIQSTCVKCVPPSFDLTNVASRNVVQVRGLYKVWRRTILRASNY